MAQTDEDEHSRVVSEYSVYWNQPPAKKRILLLQVPSRQANQPFNDFHHSRPIEIRIKPRSGLIEIDIPIPINREYDRRKGAKFAAALKQGRPQQAGSTTTGGKGEYGLAGGFGINAHMQMRAARPNPPGKDALHNSLDDETQLEDGRGAVMMPSLTLGGRLRLFKQGDPIYAIGLFKGSALLLTMLWDASLLNVF